MKMIQNILILFLIASCASAPKQEALTSFSDSHPSCQIEASDLQLSVLKTSETGLTRGLKTSGSLVFTTIGYVTDVVVIGAGVVSLAWLCGESSGGNCLDVAFTPLSEFDYTGIGNWTFDKTASWRCPYVDHISQAIRKSAKCNYEHEHFIEAYEQLQFLEQNRVMKNCLSNLEEERVSDLRNSFPSASGSNLR